MSRTKYASTFTVTVTSDAFDDDRRAAMRRLLESTYFPYEAEVSEELSDGPVEVSVPYPHAERDARLLTLKGWLYGEYLKQQAGLPSEWDQSTWGLQTSCGTSCCAAGKVVLDAGGKFVNGTVREDGSVSFYAARMSDGEEVHIENKAADLLGLTGMQASYLFAGSNGYEQMKRMIDQIIAGEPLY